MELYIIMYLNIFIIIDKFKLISIRGVWGQSPHVLDISQFRCIPKKIFTTSPLIIICIEFLPYLQEN